MFYSIILLCRVFWFMLYHVCLTCVIKNRKKEVWNVARRMKKMTGDCNQVENPRMISVKNVNPGSLK